jgi:hypothetical protein
MVTAITVTNAGSGYTSLPAVQIDPPIGLLFGQTNATLNITGITSNNIGNYFVVVSNAYGSVTSSIASLTIASPPSISQQPQSTNVVQGGNVLFNVNASGTSPVNYQWCMVSGTQGNATAVPTVINGFVLGANVTSSGTGYLAAPSVQIVSGSGTGASGYAVVSNRMVSAINMISAGSGYSTPPTIQIDPPTAVSLPGQTNATLFLTGVTNGNAGNYYVLVTNNYGSVTSSLAGLVILPCSPPQSFACSAINSNHLNLQFTGSPNYPYILQIATNLTTPINWRSVLTNPADANGNWIFTITNISTLPTGFYRAVGQ